MVVNLGVKPAKYENGLSVAEVMTYNHYGTETIPPRPVLRIAAENVSNREDIKDALAIYLHNTIINPNDAEKLEKEMLRKIGVQVIKEAKRIIEAETELQENAPATIAHKGKNKPLYETGLLIKNLAFDYEY